MTPIAAAVAPLKQEAIDKATQFAHTYVSSLLAELAAADGDANKAAPYPRASVSRIDYAMAYAKYTNLRKLCVHIDHVRRASGPEYIAPDLDRIASFFRSVKEDAAAQYDAFVAKLESKVGAHETAVLTGNHVWGYSHLLVTRQDGTRQTWKTQQIVNISKLGKVFNQWPTRLVK